MYHWVVRHPWTLRERKKIIKENEMSEMIDGERKSREKVLGCPKFWDIQITYLHAN